MTLLLGALLLRGGAVAPARRAQRARRELAEAFDALAQEIRLCLTPLPELLRAQGYGAEADAFFRCVLSADSEDFPDRWASAARELPLREEEREFLALLGMRLGGDGEGAALTLGAQRLRARYEREEGERKTREHLLTVLCLSLGTLLCVVLI